MDVGTRVTVHPKDHGRLPEGHPGFGTVRELAPTELFDPPRTQYWVELDGLSEWQWDWFFEDELSLVSDEQPASRIGDTLRCDG